MHLPRNHPWFSVLLASWFFVTFAYFVPAATWNPVSRFDLTRSIVEHRTLAIDAFADSTGDRAFADGHWYSDKAPLPALLAVPVYAIAYAWAEYRGELATYTATGTDDNPALHVRVNRPFARGLYLCSLSTAAVGGAALAVAIFEVLRRRHALLVALGASMITLLGTPLFPYATSFYGHTLAAAFLFAAVALLDERTPSSVLPTSDAAAGERDRRGPKPPDGAFGPTSRGSRLRWSGMCLVAAIGCEYLTAVPAAVVVVQVLRRVPVRARWATVGHLMLGGLAPALAIAAYHTACFGAPWRTGYSFVVHPRFVAGQARGFLGVGVPSVSTMGHLLFGTRRGLFYVAPITALGLFAMIDAVRRKSRDWLFPVGLTAGFALLFANAGYYMWWGGAAAGPRHLVPALGFTSVGLAVALSHRCVRFMAVPLACISMLEMLLLVGVGLEAPEEGNIVLDYAWRAFREGHLAGLSGASNWAIAAGLPPGASLGPILAWWIAGGHYLARALVPASR